MYGNGYSGWVWGFMLPVSLSGISETQARSQLQRFLIYFYGIGLLSLASNSEIESVTINFFRTLGKCPDEVVNDAEE